MQKRNYVTILLVGIVFALLCACAWLKPDTEHSVSERRKLKQMPELSIATILSGKFMGEFESYSLDQFPFRDEFRSFKALTSVKSDNNGIYVVDGVINDMDYPMNEDNLVNAGNRFQNVYEMLLKDKGCDLYFSIIPDKNYFYAQENGYLAYDYSAMVESMREKTDYMTYIDIFPLLRGDSYYKTDTHWKQESILPVAEELLSAMGNSVHATYTNHRAEGDFYGVYYGQAALPLAPEAIQYLTNDVIDGFKVFDFEHSKEIPVYDESMMQANDPYELFLGGPLSLVTIENEKSENNDHLVVFRDSFGSSLAPLLAQGYEKTTLIDIRYLQPAILKNMVDFTDADVLFIYSSMVLNHSETLK